VEKCQSYCEIMAGDYRRSLQLVQLMLTWFYRKSELSAAAVYCLLESYLHSVDKNFTFREVNFTSCQE